MTYQLPSPYKCVKCDHEFQYSSSHSHSGPVFARELETERGTFTQHMPTCPKCWAEFIMANVGLGFSTQKWKPEGSDYELEKAKLEEKSA